SPQNNPTERTDSPRVSKPTKWTDHEGASIVKLRRDGTKWKGVAEELPGRSATSCRLRYQKYLERRPQWDETKLDKLALLYDSFQGGHVDGIPTDDSSEDDLESPTTVDRHGIEAGTLENPRVRQSARPGEHRVELPPATSPNFSCQGEQRDEQTSSKPPRNAKDFQVDSRLSNHTALDARCDADATSVERLAHTTDDQTQHTVENSANPADHARSCQPEYASDHREDFERMPWEGPGLPPVQAAHGGLSMPASQGLLGTGGAQPSPGIAFCSHFEDALGEGFDSWYGPIEAAVQGVESLPASASMSDWDAWLQQ
ncbi:hypothetical protein LTS02_017902, partial [Friedmanniomyces endolithicus]